jgi:hypothetical protein
MDSGIAGILTGGAVAVFGMLTYGFTKQEAPHKACIKECKATWGVDFKQYPEMRTAYMDCVQKCTGIDTSKKLRDVDE